eukprot:gnl/TRDRNA2_/TRDRNA2_78496_c1_seq1.p1 gnl/TRDRNA2_/TRDRNA2_78496_c1~~gnl/TRDRNA2_/TRDRNA2_78496_c1_seq1.p1  ORF type:complete len:367 (+),score=73.80 gnl/TRDRNA2_/TRDRNA2_78496_c1_seq1:155-1102(+)
MEVAVEEPLHMEKRMSADMHRPFCCSTETYALSRVLDDVDIKVVDSQDLAARTRNECMHFRRASQLRALDLQVWSMENLLLDAHMKRRDQAENDARWTQVVDEEEPSQFHDGKLLCSTMESFSDSTREGSFSKGSFSSSASSASKADQGDASPPESSRGSGTSGLEPLPKAFEWIDYQKRSKYLSFNSSESDASEDMKEMPSDVMPSPIFAPPSKFDNESDACWLLFRSATCLEGFEKLLDGFERRGAAAPPGDTVCGSTVSRCLESQRRLGQWARAHARDLLTEILTGSEGFEKLLDGFERSQHAALNSEEPIS